MYRHITMPPSWPWFVQQPVASAVRPCRTHSTRQNSMFRDLRGEVDEREDISELVQDIGSAAQGFEGRASADRWVVDLEAAVEGYAVERSIFLR